MTRSTGRRTGAARRFYGADSTIPLHPTVLSEDAGSLLPGQVRPALLWTVTMDGDGERTDTRVERALVRSRAKLDYDEVQAALDDGHGGGVAAAAPRGRARSASRSRSSAGG